MEKAGLYIHIPFCVQKCLYCDFLSYSGRFHFAEPYVQQLCLEMESKGEMGKKLEFDTIFIGGGTPSSIQPEWIHKILNTAGKVYAFTDAPEISIEVNPGTITEDMVRSYKEMGINRISMGVQSTSNRLLRSMGRIHTKEDALVSANTIKKHFTNVNFDFISGIPGIGQEEPQTLEELQGDLACIQNQSIPHVSVYSMITEPGTPLYQLTEAGKVQACNEELERKMYHHIRNTLLSQGYVHYEISNFARPGFICKHNMKYWQGKPYLGVGLGSASFMPGENNVYNRSTNVANFEQYLAQNDFPPEESVPISFEERKREYMMLGFRLLAGPDAQLYESLFQSSMEEDFRNEMDRLSSKGLILNNRGLSIKGLDYANEIFREFV